MTVLEKSQQKRDEIRARRASADELIAELEKVRDKLPKEAKDALDKHLKKAGKMK